MKLLLASKSAARRQMLAEAGVPFETVEAPLDETAAKAGLVGRPPREVATALAELKALSVTAAPDELVLAADQVLELDDGMMLSKPASRDEAREQLRRMSGRTHRLYSAAVLAANGAPVWRATESVRLTMRPLGGAFLEDYLDAEYEAIRWSVGGYRIEGRGVQLLETIEGSHFAILGLPLLPLLGELRRRGLLLD